MLTIVAIDIGDIFKTPYPFVHAQQIEIGGTNKKDRPFGAVEKSPNTGNTL
jgi:hypothetical protein